MRVAIIGGDRRMLYAAEEFLKDGCSASAAGFEKAKLPEGLVHCPAQDAVSNADAVILPVRPADGEMLNAPLSDEKMPLTALGQLIGEKPVFCGFSDSVKPYLRGCLYDYAAREEFSIRNAVLTAEGAIGLLIGASSDSLFAAEILVIGYGRIGRVLSRYLRELGADVTVAARREESRAWARADGCAACGMTLSGLGTFRMIVNTAPALIITADRIAALRRDAVILDLASAPGGVDREAALQRGIRCIYAPGLPGRTAPAAAGRIIKDTISHIIKEENGGKDNSRLCDDRFLLHLC